MEADAAAVAAVARADDEYRELLRVLLQPAHRRLYAAGSTGVLLDSSSAEESLDVQGRHLATADLLTLLANTRVFFEPALRPPTRSSEWPVPAFETGDSCATAAAAAAAAEVVDGTATVTYGPLWSLRQLVNLQVSVPGDLVIENQTDLPASLATLPASPWRDLLGVGPLPDVASCYTTGRHHYGHAAREALCSSVKSGRAWPHLSHWSWDGELHLWGSPLLDAALLASEAQVHSAVSQLLAGTAGAFPVGSSS